MSEQSDVAEAVYGRLGRGLVSTAQIAREVRNRWGADHGFMAVHGFVREVGTCLLFRGDVQVGDLKDGVFSAWNLGPDEADAKLSDELMSLDSFIDDDSRYVFRKTP
jgi:hypothetical protein